MLNFVFRCFTCTPVLPGVSVVWKRFVAVKAQAKPKVVFVLGGPGSGKGTQCKLISKEFGFVHLSGGDLLREERQRKGSKYGELIEDHIKNSKIVPIEITLELIRAAMKRSGKDRFLVDGFPRNRNNLDGWNEGMSGRVELVFVLYVEVDDETSAGRCLKRGAQGSGRIDDNADVIKVRIKTFHDDTLPVIEYFEKRKLIRRVDGSKPPDQVFEQVKKTFKDARL